MYKSTVFEWSCVLHIITAERVLNQLKESIAELKYHSEVHSAALLFTMHRRRRTIPWFGFIGKIAKLGIGILTYEEGGRYQKAMLKLNEAQRNISHLVGQETHIVQFELHKLHESAVQREKEIKNLKLELSNVATGLNGISSFLTRQNSTLILENLALVLEAGLNEYQHTVERMLSVIHTSREGSFHLSLMTNKQIAIIAREAQNYMLELKFPVALLPINLPDLMKSSAVSIRTRHKKLIAALDSLFLDQIK